jgi:predicted dehydrogenase
MLADDSIDLVVNLSIHHAHYEVITQCLEAGKHVHSEKPLSMTYAEAKKLVDLAEAKGLRLSCSPFTYMGEAQQTAWKAIREGKTGPVRAVYAEVNHGRIESWHPNPGPFYDVGPLFDVGVYPLTIATTFFGPAKRVTAAGKVLYPDRVTKEGVKFKVTTPDFHVAVIELAGGELMRLTVNFYVRSTKQGGSIEFHGDAGSVYLGNFQQFHTAVEYAPFGEEFEALPYVKEPYKGTEWGRVVVEMAEAMEAGRPQRATGAQAAHVVEILEAITKSAKEGRAVDLTSTFTPPAPMDWAE